MLVVLDRRDHPQRNGLKYKREKEEQSIPFHGVGEMKSLIS